MPAQSFTPPMWSRRLWARFRSEFSEMGQGMEGPAHFAGADIECPDVAGRGRQSLGQDAAENQQVLVDGAGGGYRDRNGLGFDSCCFPYRSGYFRHNHQEPQRIAGNRQPADLVALRQRESRS